MGIHPQTLQRLVKSGKLERVARGLYRLPDPHYEITEHHGLVIGASVAPKGVVCLISALHFHVIGTQLPRKLWMALPRGTREPRPEYPPMRFVHMSGAAFTAGIEEHVLEGQVVKIYDVSKTVVDCFKFRNKIGMDVALEALKESWQERRLDMNLVSKYARICRVWRVIKPYLEAITA
jgi:predicted transcriptional regulator of viral defense system